MHDFLIHKKLVKKLFYQKRGTQLNNDDWKIFYDIEDRLKCNETDQEDIGTLLQLIRKINGNIVEPRAHEMLLNFIKSL